MMHSQFVRELCENAVRCREEWTTPVAALGEGRDRASISDGQILFNYSRCGLCGEGLFTEKQLAAALEYWDTAEEVLDALYSSRRHQHPRPD